MAIADPGGTDKITANFSNMGTVDVDATGTGGTSVTVGTTFTNQGTLVIGNSGITNATTVTVATLTNAGTIDLTGGSALATLDITGATPTTLVGSYVLQGNALLEVPSSVSPSGGSVTAIAGNAKLVLSGAQSRVAQSGSTTTNSGLTGLTSNAGTLAIQLGSSITTAAGLTNSGTIKVDNNYFGTGDTGGSTLAVGGDADQQCRRLSLRRQQRRDHDGVGGNRIRGPFQCRNYLHHRRHGSGEPEDHRRNNQHRLYQPVRQRILHHHQLHQRQYSICRQIRTRRQHADGRRNAAQRVLVLYWQHQPDHGGDHGQCGCVQQFRRPCYI